MGAWLATASVFGVDRFCACICHCCRGTSRVEARVIGSFTNTFLAPRCAGSVEADQRAVFEGGEMR